MDSSTPLIVAVLGIVIAALGAVLTIRIARGGPHNRLDRPTSLRIVRRIDEIGRVAQASSRYRATAPSRDATNLPTPQRRLWRDTSAILVTFGVAVLVVATALDALSPAGAVLEATSAPRPGATNTNRAPAEAEVSDQAPVEQQLATPGVTAEPSIRAATAATTSARPSQSATHVPSPTPNRPRPTPTSDRMAVLTACPDRPDCYVYAVRRGDNLASIANWFGIPYRTVLSLNPQIRVPSELHAGDRLTLPTPQR